MRSFDTNRIRDWTTTAIEVFYPPRCSGCGLRGRWVCAECLIATPLFADPRCTICSMPLAGGSCSCDQLPTQIDRLWVAGSFDGWLRQAIHFYKFSGETVRAAHFASFLAPACANLGPNVMLVPVPLHPRRKRQRGYEQTLILAEAISKRTGQAVFRGLKKARDTPHQVGLNRSERSTNLLGAFELEPGSAAPAHAVLIDDVFTTGSTLTECAIALRKGGVLSVAAVVIAHGV